MKNELREYADRNYKDKIDPILKNNLTYSTKLAGIIKMAESYYDAYMQNQREIIRICNKIALENAKDAEHVKQINRTTKNKYNKLDNLDSQFQKLLKLFAKEFTSLFMGDVLEELLLDTFDRFWEENVLINESEIKIKTDESN